MTKVASALDRWRFDEFVRSGANQGITTPAVVDGTVGPTVFQNGRELVNFASINFLDLQQRSDVRAHFREGIDRYGLTTGGSRMTQGISRPHLDLETEISLVTGKERTISFATGLLANIGFVHAMSQALDLGMGTEVNHRDAVFVLDRDAHWSLWKATSGLEFGRRLFAFRHNDPDDLDRVLRRAGADKAVVVVESMYSADGGMAPVGALLDVCEQHEAVSFVDDANGFLLYGPGHRPFAAEYEQIRQRADFVMVSLSKAVGLEGGALSGPGDAISAFEVLSGTSMFTAAMQPPTAWTAARIIELLRDDHSIIDRYLARVAKFRQRLAGIGCPPSDPHSYIISVPINDDDAAVRLRDVCTERGYLVPLFLYPAVKRNNALLRLIINAGHTDEQLDGFLAVLAEIKQRFGF